MKRRIIQIHQIFLEELFEKFDNIINCKLKTLTSSYRHPNLCIQKVAKIIGAAKLTIQNHITKWLLSIVVIGKRVFIKRTDLEINLKKITSKTNLN